MVVEVDGTVFSEERRESFTGEGVGMYAAVHQNHEICDVYDANTELRSVFAEKGGCGDNFEGHFYTNTDEHTDRKREVS
jgi:hypothetical protein